MCRYTIFAGVNGAGKTSIYKSIYYEENKKEEKEVLDFSRELLKSSFKYREEFNKLEPLYQVNNWDAGWY
ncbi:hypothetical protein P8F83_04935 [Clostridium intestinale]|nr:hypothetical protein P8F83_04935 [Clostridium intestinale]